jgi:hypothetical protein
MQEIKSAIQRLNKAELDEVHEWLENVLEDQLEMTDDFKVGIENSEHEMKKKRPRVRLP